jgi:serine/threonine-protein kinase SRPK3
MENPLQEQDGLYEEEGDLYGGCGKSPDAEGVSLGDHYDISGEFYCGSDSHGGTDDDYTESDDEGADSYKPGGYHPVHVGEVYHERYEVLSKLGWGHFSTVWLCVDLAKSQDGKREYVALKIQKSAQHYTEAAYDEIDLLSKAEENRQDPNWVVDHPIGSGTGVVSLLDFFETEGPNGVHVCMVFEVMGPNVLSLIKKYDFKGVPIPVVKRLTADILVGLDYLHRVCGIIHTDLKPENVLVACPFGIPVNKLGEPLIPTKKKLTRNQRKRLAKKKKNSPIQSAPTISTPTVTTKKRKNKKKPLSSSIVPPPMGSPTPPYVKPLLKPSRSDPSLLSFYHNDHPKRMPYHHPKSLFNRARNISAASSPSLTVVQPPPLPDLKTINIFSHPSACYKIADLGNACWVDRHFSEEIQTRQYRSPEVLIGAGYNTSADIWSLACMVFELVTGDYLFDPKPSDEYPRDEDHLALIIELLGDVPEELIEKGTKSKTYFTRKGQLRHIKQLRYWGLADVLHQKYRVEKQVADELAEFLMPMLTINPEDRANAKDLLKHKWITQQ